MGPGGSFWIAFRSFGRERLVPSLVVGTLALAIGLAAAMFAVVDAMVLRPVPYPVAPRLVEIRYEDPKSGQSGSRFDRAGLAALRAESNLFSAVEAYSFGSATLTDIAEPRIVAAPRVTPGLLSALGVTPLLGRSMTSEDAVGTTPVALLSEALWKQSFGGDPAALGRRISIDHVAYTIVGVLPAAFRFPYRNVDVWRVLSERDDAASGPGGRGAMATLGVLAKGVSIAEADARLRPLSGQVLSSALDQVGWIVRTARLVQERAADRFRPAMFAMIAASILVLLVAAINVTNLLLIRAAAREGELAMRAALGASRRRLSALVAIEASMLAVAGTAAGLLVARGLLAALALIQPEQMAYLSGAEATVGGRVALVTVTVAVLLSALVSLLPMRRSTAVDMVVVLNRRSRSITGADDDRWQGGLLTVQLALVTIVVATTALLSISFVRAIRSDPGFRTDDLIVSQFWFSAERYRAPLLALRLIEEVDRLLEIELPGARATYAVGMPPRQGIFAGGTLEIEGRPSEPGVESTWSYVEVAPDYFEVMGVPLRRGRTFAVGEESPVIVINDVLARRYWGDRSPLGDRIRYGADQPWRTIIGVAGDVRQPGLDEILSGGVETYIPFSRDQRLGIAHLAIRAAGSAPASWLRERVRRMDPDLPVETKSMAQLMSDAPWQPRFLAQLALAFAAGAVAVAAVGIYGVAAARTLRRRRELAVRLAVGATPAAVARLVIGRGLRVAMAGTSVGLAGAWVTARSLQHLLFDTPPGEPLAMAGAVVVLAGVAIAGSTLPAIVASRIDPATVLKAE